jgi:hypothetical protein
MRQLGLEIFEHLNAKQNVGNQQPVVYGKGGMSSAEVADIERQLGFPIPEDFKYLLQNMKDEGGVMFPWAKFDKGKYEDTIGWVLSGIEFDIRHNAFWMESRWGLRPEEIDKCLKIFREDFPSWPKLLPLLGHRFLPAEPCITGNPVFSIVQTDIIYYGDSLASYLLEEFIPGQEHAENTKDVRNRIDVWADIADL